MQLPNRNPITILSKYVHFIIKYHIKIKLGHPQNQTVLRLSLSEIDATVSLVIFIMVYYNNEL